MGASLGRFIRVEMDESRSEGIQLMANLIKCTLEVCRIG